MMCSHKQGPEIKFCILKKISPPIFILRIFFSNIDYECVKVNIFGFCSHINESNLTNQICVADIRINFNLKVCLL